MSSQRLFQVTREHVLDSGYHAIDELTITGTDGTVDTVNSAHPKVKSESYQRYLTAPMMRFKVAAPTKSHEMLFDAEGYNYMPQQVSPSESVLEYMYRMHTGNWGPDGKRPDDWCPIAISPSLGTCKATAVTALAPPPFSLKQLMSGDATPRTRAIVAAVACALLVVCCIVVVLLLR